MGWRAQRADEGRGERVTELMVTRWPVWAYLLDTLVVDWACRATGHRYCNSRLMMAVLHLTDRRCEVFLTRVPPEEIERLEAWRGDPAPFWVDTAD